MARLFGGALVLGVVFALALSVSGLLVPASQRAALGASITATLISGEASVVRAGGLVEALPDGAVLHAGETVRTGPETRLVLTYFEGSTVEIEPSSELTIDEAAFGEGGATLIRMTQLAGHTWHVVTKLLGSGSRYEVRTPTSTATVRGTQFEVDVAAAGDTRVSTTEGAVATSDASGTVEVVVTAGLETTVKVGESPAPPAPMPQPQRKVSVQLDSASSTVVDAFGRANGVKDGKVIIQTPGAKVERGAGGIVVILPDPPEGRVAVVERERSEVKVVTTVQSRGGEAVRTETTVQRNGTSPSVVAALPAAPALAARAANPGPSSSSVAASGAAAAGSGRTSIGSAGGSLTVPAASVATNAAGVSDPTLVTVKAPSGASPSNVTTTDLGTTAATVRNGASGSTVAAAVVAPSKPDGRSSTAVGAVVAVSDSPSSSLRSAPVAVSDSPSSSSRSATGGTSDQAKTVSAPEAARASDNAAGGASPSSRATSGDAVAIVASAQVDAPAASSATVPSASDHGTASVVADGSAKDAAKGSDGSQPAPSGATDAARAVTVDAATGSGARTSDVIVPAAARAPAERGVTVAPLVSESHTIAETIARVVERVLVSVRERVVPERARPESVERARSERDRENRNSRER